MLMSYIEYYPGPAAEDEFFFRKVRGEYKDILDLRIRPPALKNQTPASQAFLLKRSISKMVLFGTIYLIYFLFEVRLNVFSG